MKTNLLKVAFVAAIALVSGVNMFKSQKSEILSDVALANVEALAQNETGAKVYCCGNSGTCAKILGGGEIVGIAFYTPCP